MDMPIDMQHQAMGYDRAATMFSPEGHLLQVEYAEKAIRLGSSSVGIVCSDGILIIAHKKIKDKLMVQKSRNKIYEIDSHIIASSAGILADARVLVEKAQLISQQNKITYDSPVEPELVIKDISNIKQQFSQYGGSRPFGISLMIAGINNGKPELHTSDVTGNYFTYNANAIGENDEKIKEALRESYKHDLTIKKATNLILDIFKKIQEKNFDLNNFELAYIESKQEKIQRLSGEKIKELIK